MYVNLSYVCSINWYGEGRGVNKKHWGWFLVTTSGGDRNMPSYFMLTKMDFNTSCLGHYAQIPFFYYYYSVYHTLLWCGDKAQAFTFTAILFSSSGGHSNYKEHITKIKDEMDRLMDCCLYLTKSPWQRNVTPRGGVSFSHTVLYLHTYIHTYRMVPIIISFLS